MDVRIRRATQADQSAIQHMVRQAGLNPINVRWPNFALAEEDGRVVGVGQLRPHSDGSRELASLVVVSDCRRRGVGGQLVRALLADQPPPVYLFCERDLEGYYARFSFQAVLRSALPRPLARMHRLANALARVGSALSRRDISIIAMRWDG